MQQAGWWADPSARHWMRYFDGRYWTAWVYDGQVMSFDVIGSNSPPAVQPSWSPPNNSVRASSYPTFKAAAGAWAVLALVGATVASSITGVALWLANAPEAVTIVAAYSVLFSMMAYTCLVFSRRWGTNSLGDDFGLTWRPRDIGWGLLAWFVASWASVIATQFVDAIPGMDAAAQEYVDSNEALGSGPFVAWALFGILIAPVVEELFFRGLLLRAFHGRMHIAWAITLQALVFGCYHLSFGLGLYNISYLVSTAVFGFIMGWIVAWRRALGVTMTAHFVTNLVVFAAMAAAR